ncbi:MAG: hypothetical protein ACLT8E_05820 [Akkermansia sp.]
MTSAEGWLVTLPEADAVIYQMDAAGVGFSFTCDAAVNVGGYAAGKFFDAHQAVLDNEFRASAGRSTSEAKSQPSVMAILPSCSLEP